VASPQTEDGFTRIANELLDALICADLTKRQLRVALAIVRQTYGFNRKSDDISGSRLAAITGMARQHCNAALIDLDRLRVIVRESGRWGTSVSVQKDYEQWQCMILNSADTKSVSTCNQNGVTDEAEVTTKQCQVDTDSVSDRHQNGVVSDTDSVHTIDSKDNSKDSSKDTGANSLEQRFESWWKLYPKKRNRGQALRSWKVIKPDTELTMQMIMATEAAKQSIDWQKQGGKFIPYPATWLRAQGWLDEYQVDVSAPMQPVGACGATVANLQALFGGNNESENVRKSDRISIGSV